MPQPQVNIIDALDKASAEDLAKIDTEIADMERRLEGLRAVRRLLDIRLNGKPKRQMKPRQAAEDNNGVEKLYGQAIAKKRRQLCKYLSAAGKSSPRLLANQCEIPLEQIDKILQHDFFLIDSAGVALSPAGRSEATR